MENGIPLTGVINTNNVHPEVIDDIFNKGIDLDYEEFIEEYGEGASDDYECQGPTILLGFRKDSEGKYDIDDSAEYSIKYNGDSATIQVVHSKYIKLALRPCSPCYPNQADLESNDGLLFAYSLKKEDINDYADDSVKQGIFEYVKIEHVTG